MTFRARLGVVVILACAALTAIPVAHAEDGERYSPSVRAGREGVLELAQRHFPPDLIPWVMRTARCETGGTFDPYVRVAGYDSRLGVFYDFNGALQVDAVTWAAKARELFDGDLSDPDVGFAMAAWIVEHYGTGPWPVCGH